MPLNFPSEKIEVGQIVSLRGGQENALRHFCQGFEEFL
jgi:hypothetical protein